MVYLNKYENVEYWLYTGTGDVFSCEETEDGLAWYDGHGWDVTSENFCEKLTNARTEVLSKMPKRVELKLENDIKKGFLNSRIIDKIYWILVKYPENKLLRTIIEEVQE